MNIKSFTDRFNEAARRQGFTLEYYGHLGSIGLPAYHRPADAPVGSLYISTGVHGDEPAGPMAVLEAMRRGLFPHDFDCHVLPLINPSGLGLGTRENAQGIDLNRDYSPEPASEEIRSHKSWLRGRRFDACLCLHEDYEGEGFYLYELLHGSAGVNGAGAHEILEAAARHIPRDPRKEIDGMPSENGLMIPPPTLHLPDRVDQPEALFLHFHHTPRCYTLETPSGHPITSRIAAQLAAMCACMDWLRADLRGSR